MIQIEFSETEQKSLNHERYHHDHYRVRQKMEVLWLKSQGLNVPEVSRLADVSPATVYRYIGEYREGGVEQLKVLNFYRPESELTPYGDLIAAHFREQPPATIKEASHVIERLTGLKRSETQIRQFLLNLGLKRRKVGMIPAKADPAEQERFRLEELEPVLEAAKEGKKKSTL